MKIDSELTERLQAASGERQEIAVIITLERVDDIESLKSIGVKPSIAYQSIPAVAARLTPDQIKSVAGMPQLTRIEFDGDAKALEKR